VPRQDIHVPDIPKPLAHYTPAARAAHLVFAAGQIASDYKTGVHGEARVDPAFPYYGSEIKAAGTSLDNVVKAQVFMVNLDDFNGLDEVWREFFPTPPPRTTVGTTGLLVRDALVEIDLIATMP